MTRSLLFALLLAGCSSSAQDEVAKAFPPGQANIVTDARGTEWAVSHNVGDTYFIRPVRKAGK